MTQKAGPTPAGVEGDPELEQEPAIASFIRTPHPMFEHTVNQSLTRTEITIAITIINRHLTITDFQITSGSHNIRQRN